MKVARLLATLLRTDSPSLLIVGRTGATALAFVTAPIIARSIGPVGRGETAAAIATFSILPILLAFGVPLEVRRLAAIGKGKAALRTARTLCVSVLPISAAVAWLAHSTIFASFEADTRIVATIGLALAPLAMSWMCDLGVLIGVGRLRGVMTMQLLQPGVYLISILVFLAFGAVTTSTVLIANVLGTLSSCFLGMSLTRTGLRGERHPMRGMLGASARFAGSSIAESASNRLDQVIALPLMGAFQAGIYSAAVTVASVPFALGQALGASYFPLVARSEGEDRQHLREQAIRVSTAISLMCVPFMVPAIWIGIPILFGSEFNAAVPVAWASFGGTAVMIVAYVCSMALAAEGRGNRMTIAQTGSLIVGVILLFLLAPTHGALGAAIASASSYLILLALLVGGMRVRLRESILRRNDFPMAFSRIFRSSKRPPSNEES